MNDQYARTHMDTRTQTHKGTHTHTHTRIQAHKHIRIHTHAHKHVRGHTHTHTHTWGPMRHYRSWTKSRYSGFCHLKSHPDDVIAILYPTHPLTKHTYIHLCAHIYTCMYQVFLCSYLIRQFQLIVVVLLTTSNRGLVINTSITDESA